MLSIAQIILIVLINLIILKKSQLPNFPTLRFLHCDATSTTNIANWAVGHWLFFRSIRIIRSIRLIYTFHAVITVPN